MRPLPVIIFLLALIVLQDAAGQRVVIGARDEVAVDAAVDLAAGAKNVDGTPTLLPNMKPGYSFGLRYTTRLARVLQVGAWANTTKFGGWDSGEDNGLYAGANMSLLSFGPVIMLKPWSPHDLKRNKYGYCVMITPGVSNIKVGTTGDSGVNDDTGGELLAVNSVRFTIGLHAGISINMTNSVGVHAMFDYRYTAADSKVFSDPNFSWLSLNAGAFWRIHKDRRYKYSSL